MIVASLRKFYRAHIHAPWLDRAIYACLDAVINTYSWFRGYHFPSNYIRRWKLNMLHQLYEPETVLVCQKIIKPGMVVIDIGAHIGYFTRIFSRLVGRNGKVYAFEADPENFSLLKKNTKHLRNVEIYQLAVSDRQGTIDFYHYDEKAGCHSTLPNVPLDYKKRKISVAANTLDAVLAEAGSPRVDVVKMDIEGGESAALRGMDKLLAAKEPLALLLEFAPAWIEASGVPALNFLQELTKHGFILSAILESSYPLISPVDKASYKQFLPKTPTHYNEFINLYCVRNGGTTRFPYLHTSSVSDAQN